MKTPRFFGLLFACALLAMAGYVTCATATTPPSRAPTGPLDREDYCPPLDPPGGPTVNVSTEASLRDQAYNAAPGTSIIIAAGTYNMQSFVQVVNNGIALRGATGNRDDVVLDFGGMTGGHFGILVESDDVTIADLTIRNANDHGVSIQGSDRPLLYNLHIQDIGDQLVKVNPRGDGSEDGLLACSRLEYTTAAPNEYTNGISAHDAHRWTVRDNDWYRIRTPGNSAVPTILFWSGSSDTIVERNLLVDCYQGIAFGNASHGAGDHSGGIVRNNFIYASMPHDSVVEMVHATGWLVAHNTALLLNPNGVTWGMEARFADTQGTFAYNLTNMTILADRDGAQGTLTGNVTNAQSDWFANPAGGDLHLVSSATAAIDQAATLSEVSDDFDGDARPIGPAPDVGADEYGTAASLALSAPTGGEHWPVNSQRQIRWTASGTITQVNLSYSTDQFATHTDIATTLASAGNYDWTTPASPTTTMRVRIESVANPAISDTSLDFTLYDPSTFTNTVYLSIVLSDYGTPTATDGELVSDLTYLGAFRLPGDDTPPLTFAYGGNAMTFNPDGDPGSQDGFPGSLFVTGHDRLAYGELADGDQVAEISIPVPVVSDDLAELNQADFLQGFHDVAAGFFTELEEIPRIGMQYLDNTATGPKIHLAWGQHLQEETPVASHAWFDPALSAPDMQGTWFIGQQSLYSVNGYMLEIPASWADEHAAGHYLGTGRFRDGGWSGMGPALFAYRPWVDSAGTPAPSGTHLAETVLLLYENSLNTGDIERCLDGYQHPDEWEGGAWITTAAGKSALLFAGTKGTGAKYWYGFVNPAGPEYPCVHQESVGEFTVCRLADGTPCPEPDLTECEGHNDSRGWWSAHFDAQLILYDPADLAQVAEGTMESWEPQPYASLDIDDYLFLNPAGVEQYMLGTGVQRRFRVSAVAYDRDNALLYVLELFADETKPVVHVWRVE